MCAGCGWITALVDARSKEGGYPRGAREVLLCVCGRQPCVAPLTTSGRRRERGGVPVQQRGSSQEGLVPNRRGCNSANP